MLTLFHWKTIFLCVDTRAEKKSVTMVMNDYYIIACVTLIPFVIFITILALNRSDAKDTDISNIKDVIVDSLFSVFVTAGEFDKL